MRAQALNTHVHLRTQNKKIPHIYTLTPFSCNWLCTCLGAVDKCQLPWVTEANLTLHSLQIDCVVIVQLFLNLNLLRVHSGFTHFILLAIPYSECSLKILPYLQISQNFWLGTLPMLNIHKYTDRQKLQGSQCNDLVKPERELFCCSWRAVPKSSTKNRGKNFWPSEDLRVIFIQSLNSGRMSNHIDAFICNTCHLCVHFFKQENIYASCSCLPILPGGEIVLLWSKCHSIKSEWCNSTKIV